MFDGSSSSSCITASTTSLEKNCFCWAISFELSVVCAHFSSKLRSSSLFDLSILTAISSIFFRHSSPRLAQTADLRMQALLDEALRLL